MYPFPFSWFYPDTGNFIGFVGNLSSRSLVRQAIGAFRASTAFPSEGVAVLIRQFQSQDAEQVHFSEFMQRVERALQRTASRTTWSSANV